MRAAPAAAAPVACLALASALSIAALALAGHAPAAFGDRSTIGLCALPWLALAGLPRGAAPSRVAGSRALAPWLALGPLLVALRVELARAAEPHGPLAHAGAAWLAIAALERLARTAAESDARSRALHAFGWCALVPGVPWLAWSFELGGTSAPALVRELARASPLSLGWSASAVHALALVLPLALLALALLAQRALARATRVAVALALCAAFGASAAAAGESRIAFARIAVEGPLSELVIESEGVRTALAHEWLAGEAEELELPLGAGAAPPPGEAPVRVQPRIASRGAGSARFLGWSGERESAWAALPAGMRARAAPPLSGARARASLAALCALAALACALLALRRSARATHALALGGALLAAALPIAGERALAQRVLELQQAAPVSLERRAALGELEFPLETCVRIELEPAAAACELQLERTAQAADSLRSERAWSVRARAASEVRLDVWHVRALSAATDARTLDLASWEGLWLRGTDGSWRAAPELAAGQPASGGPELDAPRSPPGWLAAGLPQGRTVLLGRAAQAAVASPESAPAGRAAAGELWLRWVGFEPP